MYDEETSICTRRFGGAAGRSSEIKSPVLEAQKAALALSYRLDTLLQDADGNVSFSGIFASHPSAMTSVT
jgi:hypothetical protein